MKKWKLKNPYLPLVAISSTLLIVLKWPLITLQYTSVYATTTTAEGCARFIPQLSKREKKKYQQQRVKFPTSYRNWTSIKLAQYLKNVSITENVKGQLKKIYILPGYAPDRIYADSFIVLKHIFIMFAFCAKPSIK